MYAEVLIEYNNKSIDKTFTYVIPNNLKDKIKVGMQVSVYFNNRKINGFVLNIKNEFNDTYKLKEIDSIIQDKFCLNKELLLLANYLKSITLCSLISAVETMLPSSLKVKNNKDYSKYEIYLLLNKSITDIEKYLSNCKYPKQKEILNALIEKEEVLKKDYFSSAVNTLIKKELIIEEKKRVYRLRENITKDIPPKLSEEQEKAIDTVNLDNFNTYLLYGITGSGKTEVYMSLISKVLSRGKSAIMLVPEISLTNQMITRLLKRFSTSVAIFHSNLSDGEKYDEYERIYKGDVKIVVGTRSAIFTPLNNIGIIILDEEHSSTYKQENTPKYNTIDIAKWRAKYYKCPLILGSATPKIEDMTLAKLNKYKLLTLSKRIGSASLPKIVLVNMQDEYKKGNLILSELLSNKIKYNLDNNKQTMLFLNRRGYSTTVSCLNCGFVYKCPNCDITLTYHKSSNTLNCHYCGYTKYKDSNCPNCKEAALNYLGVGTEKLESLINKKFPNARVVRMDVDTTSRKGTSKQILEDFANKKYDILVGTQMISKGLDFKDVTLVGIINADTTLNIPKFRSGEETYALLTQVSGRSGRSSQDGEVIIQTFDPDNMYIKLVKEQDYLKFYNYEMTFRKKLNYPPYCFMINLLITGKDINKIKEDSNKIYEYINKYKDKKTLIYGPVPDTLAKINNIYRYQILIKYTKDNNLFKILKYLDNMYILNKEINIDIDINHL